MKNLYLVAHKVRGEPAFDIAERMVCPLCDSGGCVECDDEGFWWIIPTSGHRAYPYAYKECEWDELSVGSPPEDLPDHYATRTEPRARLDIRAMLGKHLPPQTYIRRRL